ncbi:MAG: hypothetical protein CMP77_02760 [Flavobacterium sp.]|nr:hypothetical protein [Flavobacterium sp.]
MIKNKCRICQINNADKKNSHIIPKFLSRDLFNSPLGNFAIQIDNNGNNRKIQSTAKQDYIFCTNCEHRLEILETNVSRIFKKLRQYDNFKNDFTLKYKVTQAYLELETNPNIFKLFIYSLIYRCSISNNIANKNFKLPDDIESKIRILLHKDLPYTSHCLANIFNDIEYSKYDFCLIKPERKNLGYSGMYCTFQYNPGGYIIVVNDFILFFHIDESLDRTLKIYSNKCSNKIIITLSDDQRWFLLNKLIIEKLYPAVS